MGFQHYDGGVIADQATGRPLMSQTVEIFDEETDAPIQAYREGQPVRLVTGAHGLIGQFQTEDSTRRVRMEVGPVRLRQWSQEMVDAAADASGSISAALEQVEVARSEAAAIVPRMEQIEAMAGLAPGEVTDAQTANLITRADTSTRDALNAATVQVVNSPAEQMLYVTPRGKDTNDGLTLSTAKQTLAGAVQALGGKPGVIHLGVGTFPVTGTIPLPSGTLIQGVGRNIGASLINFTGTGVMFRANPGTRSYNQKFQDVLLNGPGKTSATTALDLADVSQARLDGVTIGSFGTGIHHRSQVLGGAVYNTVTDALINSCGTGVRFDKDGSNGSRWFGVKFGACDIAVDIMDSNQNNWLACQFELNGTAFRIDATLAGLSDNNSFAYCRFERNTAPWHIGSANVRDTVIDRPAFFGPLGTPVDLGQRTQINASAPLLPPPGSQRVTLTRNGDFTLGNGEEIVLMNASGTTATLPAATTVKPGRTYTVKNISPSTTTPVHVATDGGTIDGSASVDLARWQSGVYMSDGTNWLTI